MTIVARGLQNDLSHGRPMGAAVFQPDFPGQEESMFLKRIAIMGLLAATASAQAQQDTSGRTTEFLTAAVQGNVAEIQLATLAGKRASSRDVREFADMIVADHKVALDDSTSIAQRLGVTVGSARSGQAEQHYEMLSRESGDAFDRQFIDLMIQQHRQAIDEYQSYVEQSGGDEAALAYAESTLPTLEQHLDAAEDLSDAS